MIDYIGTVLLTIGLVLFLLAITFGSSQYAWNSAAVIACFVLGISFIIIFCIWNFKFSKNQIFPIEVLKVPQVDASAIVIFAIFSYFMSSSLYLAVYFQVIWDANAWRSGLDLLPMIIPVVLASISSGVAMNMTKFVKPFAIIGAILGPIGTGLLTLLGASSTSSQKIGLLIIVGISAGIQMQSSIISSQISAPKTPGGTIMATTLINFARAFGGALGSILSDAVYTSSFKKIYRESVAKLTDESILKELQTINIEEVTSNSTILNTLSLSAREFVKEQIARAIKNVFYMCIGYACLALIASMFITNKKLPDFSGGASSDKPEEKVEIVKQEEEEIDSSEPDLNDKY